MRSDKILYTAALAFILLAQTAVADDITGAQLILCTTVEATECYAENGCSPGAPEDWNLPRFVEIDLEAKEMSTTKASGQQRVSPVKHLERMGDRIFLQGVESSRAYSIVLDQDSGTASVAIALERHVVAAFAYCTPLADGD
jgi:hypothetical protein